MTLEASLLKHRRNPVHEEAVGFFSMNPQTQQQQHQDGSRTIHQTGFQSITSQADKGPNVGRFPWVCNANEGTADAREGMFTTKNRRTWRSCESCRSHTGLPSGPRAQWNNVGTPIRSREQDRIIMDRKMKTSSSWPSILRGWNPLVGVPKTPKTTKLETTTTAA